MSHVGQMIKAELNRHPKTHTAKWFAEQLHCKRTNVYDIFNRRSVDTALLERISRILDHDFFLDLSADMSHKTTEEPDSDNTAPTDQETSGIMSEE